MIPAADYSKDWDSIQKIVETGKRFLITTHVQADPDALGSEIALAEALKSAGKQPLILNPTPISHNYTFIDVNHEVTSYEKGEPLPDIDATFILDISRWERLGTLSEVVRDSNKPKVCIDHHPYTGGHADFHLVNVQACASAEIVYDLIRFLDIDITPPIAEPLYTAILSDTGSFSFSNTSARAHQIAYELISHGVPCRSIFEKLYQNHSPERLKFMGKVLSTLQLDCDQKLAWITIPHRQLLENKIHPDDIEGFVDMARNCKNVLLSVLFLEVEPDDVKISLRAKGNFNASQLAAQFGGGGHNHASGIRLIGPLPEIEQTILAEARRALVHY
ncbi:MAG TPA: bifunctional oligoribonuclease/PAP phosphatase NrnA [Acidobacteriota bacterium]|nr:bifunctional oligoribonuclease/PAP phosphatase NrnA [Acidobacteriota bacterium]